MELVRGRTDMSGGDWLDLLRGGGGDFLLFVMFTKWDN